MNATIDRRETPAADPWLAAHAATCDRCRRQLQAYESLLIGFATLAMPPLKADFAERVIATVHRPSPQAGRRQWFSLAACLASAATMLLTVSALWNVRRAADVAQNAADVEHSIAIARQPGGALAIAQSGGKRQASRARSPITSADLLLEAPRLAEHLRMYRGAIDDLAIALPEAAQRLDEVERMTPGIRPLRISLSTIWDTLCRTIPGAHVDLPPPSRGRTSLWWLEPARIA